MPPTTTATEVIPRLLRAARRRLGLDVAFISRLDEHERVFGYVDADAADCPVRVGGSDPRAESYCHYVVSGELPSFLPDPAAHPVTAGLAATHRLPVGTHASVPIRFADGTVYGTFCCFGYEVVPTLSERSVEALRVLADVAAGYLEPLEAERLADESKRERLAGISPGDGLSMVFQPIVGLSCRRLAGVEALARFSTLGAGPAEVFADAWRLGVGPELETTAVRAALDSLAAIAEPAYLAVNVAPATLVDEAFADALADAPAHRLVVEVTEHAAVEDYSVLLAGVQRLRRLGVRIAIDDVGTGFSGLDHILRLEPDILKVDMALVRGVHDSAAKQAMIAALITFGARVGTTLVAEGVEEAAELEALRVLGVHAGQGYHLARPDPRPNVWVERTLNGAGARAATRR